MRIIFQIQFTSEKLRSGHEFWLYVHCDLGVMTFSQGHDTPLGHGQELFCTVDGLQLTDWKQ